MILFFIIIGIITVMTLYSICIYNSLVSLKNKIKYQYTQIIMNQKNRNSLIPDVISISKKYIKKEKDIIADVVDANNKYIDLVGTEKEINASNEVGKKLSKLINLADNYPKLKTDELFLKLQGELKEAEDKISYAVQFYNDRVITYNNMVQMFPSNIVSSICNFKEEMFFEIEEQNFKS